MFHPEQTVALEQPTDQRLDEVARRYRMQHDE